MPVFRVINENSSSSKKESKSVFLVKSHSLNLTEVGKAIAGADPEGGTPKLHKEGKNVARVCANTPCFSA